MKANGRVFTKQLKHIYLLILLPALSSRFGKAPSILSDVSWTKGALATSGWMDHYQSARGGRHWSDSVSVKISGCF